MLRLVIESMAEGVIILDHRGTFTSSNSSALKILGISQKELLGRSPTDSIWEATHEDGTPFLGEDLPALYTLRTGRPCLNVVVGVRHSNQEKIWISINSQPLFRENAKTLTGVVLTFFDISTLKETEKRLRESESRLIEAQRVAKMGDWRFNVLNQKITWSEQVFRLFERDPSLGPPNYRENMSYYSPEDSKRLQERVARAIEAGESYEFDSEIVLSPNKVRYHLSHIQPARDAQGRVVELFGTVQDITERKMAEKERFQLLEREKRARAEAEEANRAKDFFLALLSHELRTPLTAIFTWSQLLTSGKIDSNQMFFAAKKIEESALAQKRMIDDLLDVSRIVSGKLSLEMGVIEVSPVLIQAVDALRPSAAEKGVAIDLTIKSDGTLIRADSVRFRQIVTNLLNNALKFTPSGGKIVVRADQVPQENQIQIRVKDSGIGIRPELLPHIFSPFYQGDSSSIRTHGGLGLGLSIVHHLTKMMNGSVVAKSEGMGRGAEFLIRFPLAEESHRELVESTQQDSVSKNKTLEKMRILLVDDDERTRESIRAGLELSQASVETASSAHEALQLLSREDPDILISDIAMPVQDGYSLIKKIRTSHQSRPRKDLPAVALTAYADPETALRAQKAGFNLCLAKPILLSELVTHLIDLKKKSA